MLADLPETLAVFPLSGVLLLPRGDLPLNIFEPRYLKMVEAALATPSRLIGMIQPYNGTDAVGGLHRTGCAGKITQFSETDDGRYLITLRGVCRFNIIEELPQQDGFRRVVPKFDLFADDLKGCGGLDLDRVRLVGLLREYFRVEGLSCNWDKVKDAPDDTLITALSMICPLDPCDKQALLMAADSSARATLFLKLLEIAITRARGDHSPGGHKGGCH